MENWKPVPGYEGCYEVSDRGSVRSLDRVARDGKRLRGQAIAPWQMPSGHLRVGLTRNGIKRTLKVHRLVLLAFVGPPPTGMEVLHRDGDPTNNTLENLRWGTKSENSRDQLAHGTHAEARKVQCPSGHPYDATNTYVSPTSGHRKCRECTRINQRAAYHAKRAAQAKESSHVV